MCGIAGQWSADKVNKNTFLEQSSRLKHRGPDYSGSWFDDDSNLALAHLRLSILDLSSSGHQPMASHSSRYIISFNGEIYNFLSLKKEICRSNPLIQFKSSSDTEVLLAAIEQFGFYEAIQKCEGMFAIALWDKKNKLLSLARDRAGEKPLYYHLDSEYLFFASELKAFKSKHTNLQMSQEAINLLLSQGNIPAPHTIYQNVYKVKPGEILTFSSPSSFHAQQFWNLETISIDENLTQLEVNNTFESLFLNSVSQQMISDVPIGAFLSGGIDSSAVVAAMTEVSNAKVQTYSVGFEENNYNEAGAAKKVADHLGTQHHEFFLTEKDALDVIPDLQQIYCEPFADSSQIPTFLLCRETKKDVTVSLSGDGGDEVFAGYRRYIDIQRFHTLIQSTPYFVRAQISKFLGIYLGLKNKARWEPLIKYLLNLSHPSEQLYKISNVLLQEDLRGVFYALAMQWRDGTKLLKEDGFIDSAIEVDKIFNSSFNDVNDIRKLDIHNYLANDILVKVDRASMSNSLETRVPFLDVNLMEFGLSVPIKFLIQGSKGKLPIRAFLSKRLPQEIMNTPKTGFGVPIEFWLKGALRPWAESLLERSGEWESMGLDYDGVMSSWHLFQNKDYPLHHGFWNILMLQAWCKENPVSSQ
jgi:asparagine synthase (glutamine-hydrolysing)